MSRLQPGRGLRHGVGGRGAPRPARARRACSRDARVAVIKRGSRGARVFARDERHAGEPPLRFDIATTAVPAEDTTGRRRRVRRRVHRRLARRARQRPRRHRRAPPGHDRRPSGGRPPPPQPAHGAAAGMSAPAVSSLQLAVADRLQVADEVAAALAAGPPVVALESTLISHGLAYPANLEVARASEAAVRESGAVPATVAIRDGRLRRRPRRRGARGARDGARRVRAEGRPARASPSRWHEMAGPSTTVSATMIAAHAAGIRIFAHRAGSAACTAPPDLGRRWTSRPTSTSWRRTPMAVVCAGPKAILDVPNTLEVLETRGVPVVAIGQPELPGFYARTAGVAAPHSVADEAAAADARRDAPRAGARVGDPRLRPRARRPTRSPRQVARDAVDRANADAEAAGIHGPELTPVAARADRGVDRRSIGAGQHRIDRQQRPRWRSIGGRARCPRPRPSVD